MKLKERFNSIGFKAGLNTFLGFSVVITMLLIIIIKMLSSEFTKIVESDNEENAKLLIHQLNIKIDEIQEKLNKEANRSIIINSVMNPKQTQYYIDDYFKDLNLTNIESEIILLSFDKKIIYTTGREGIDFKKLKENESTIFIIDDLGTICLSSPALYNNLTEGYLLLVIDFKAILDSLLDQFIDFNSHHSLNLIYNNRVIYEKFNRDEASIGYREKLEKLPMEVEVFTPESIIIRPVNKLRRSFIFIAILFSIISVIAISYLTSRSLATPLIKLKDDIEKISNSKLDKISLNKTTVNEIKFVAFSFNRMHMKLIKRTNEIIETNKNLESTQKKLIHSEKMASLGQLAAGVAHEINNPTGFVHTNLETLQDYIKTLSRLMTLYNKLLSDDSRDIREEIKKVSQEEDLDFIMSDLPPLVAESLEGTKRIRDIVKGLRDFARSDNEEFKSGNVNQAIESAIKLTWNEIKYKCKVFKKMGDIPDVICNQEQLTQVFVNLLINSSHAIKDHGKIYIYSTLKKENIIIRFSDTGSGIEKENIPKLFDPFFSTKEVGKGTGLGLAISHGIVEKHGGTIEVKSKKGFATCFIITLPLRREE